MPAAQHQAQGACKPLFLTWHKVHLPARLLCASVTTPTLTGHSICSSTSGAACASYCMLRAPPQMALPGDNSTVTNAVVAADTVACSQQPPILLTANSSVLGTDCMCLLPSHTGCHRVPCTRTSELANSDKCRSCHCCCYCELQDAALKHYHHPSC